MPDYSPLTYEKAKASGDSSIQPVSKESIKKKHPELSERDISVAISFMSVWNRMNHEDRLRILREGAENELEGMVDSLLTAGLIEVGEGNGEGDEDGDEDGEGGEDGENERDRKAGEFISDEDKAFWLETVKNIEPTDLLNKPDDYPIDVINELEDEYEKDRKKLADELMNDGEFGDWYENQGGNIPDLADMGYKALYELKQQFEASKEQAPEDNEGDLIAVGLNSEEEIARRARKIAKERIENEMSSEKGIAGFFKKMWATHFKMHKQNKLEGEIREKIREKNALLIKKEGGTISASEEARLKALQDELKDDDWTASEHDTGRFVLAHVNNMRDMLSQSGGESMYVYGVEYVETDENELDENGNPKLDENGNPIKKRIPKAYRMDKDRDGNVNKQEVTGEAAEVTIAIEGAIRAYASAVGNIERDANLTAEEKRDREGSELEDFRRKMAELRQRDINNGGDGSMINNYEAVAMRAAERAKHEIGIDAVMDGFRFINGKINREINSQPHRDAVERLANTIHSVPFVPEGAAFIAAGAIMFFTRSAGNTLGRAAGGLVGGAATGAIFDSLRFMDDYREQYATAAYALATNGELGDRKFEGKMTENLMRFMTREKEGGGREKITAELLSNDLQKLTGDLNAALEAFNNNPSNDEARANVLALSSKLGESVFDARNRLYIGASQQVDLMAFSSNNLSQIEKERLDLWKSIAAAQVAYKKVENNPNIAENEIPNAEEIYKKSVAQLKGVVVEGNKAINSDVKWSAVKRGAGTFLRNIVFGLVIDDTIANFSSEKISTLEHLGIVKTQNSDTATNSLLSGFLDKAGMPGFKVGDILKGQTFSTQKDAEDYIKQNGGKQTWKKIHNPSKDKLVNGGTQSDADYAKDNFGKIGNRKWWGYGKKESIRNELRLYGKPDSMHIDMNTVSTDGLGNSINTEALQKSGDLKLLISLSKDSQQYPIQIPFDANGYADYSGVPAEVMKRISAGDIYMAEVAQTNGSVTNVFASMPYYKGGGSIAIQKLEQGFDYVVEELKTLRDPGVSFEAASFLATAFRTGRSLKIKRNGGAGGPTGGGEGGPTGGGEGGPTGGPTGGPEGPGGGPTGGPEGPDDGPDGPDGGPDGPDGGPDGPDDGPDGPDDGPDGGPEGPNGGPTGGPEGPDGGGEGGPTGGPEGPTGSPEGGEDVNLVPLTIEELSRAGMRPIDVKNRMNEMLNKILPTISSPEDRNELSDAVKNWNNMKPTQWRIFLTRPENEFSPENRAMLEVLKKYNMIKRR